MKQDPYIRLAVLAVFAFLGWITYKAFLSPPLEIPIPPEPHEQWIESVDADIYEGQRSSKWQSVRDAFIKKHPVCEACGTSENLNVHHVEPFHLKPELELQPKNLMTLCRKDHYYLGHDPDGPWKPAKPNWTRYNPLVRTHAELVRKGKKY